jgi:hypothetical protein
LKFSDKKLTYDFLVDGYFTLKEGVAESRKNRKNEDIECPEDYS